MPPGKEDSLEALFTVDGQFMLPLWADGDKALRGKACPLAEPESHRHTCFPTCLDFLPVQTLAQLADALVHHGHLHVALIQEVLLLLQF